MTDLFTKNCFSMDRSDYMREYNAKRKETQRLYYKGYNAKPANRRRRHNRYLRDKKRWQMEEAFKALLLDIEVSYEIVKPKNQ